MSEVITAVYERGVFRPIEDVHLREHQKVRIILEPNSTCRREFRNFLEKIHRRTARFSSPEIEKDITLASQEIRKTKNAHKNPH